MLVINLLLLVLKKLLDFISSLFFLLLLSPIFLFLSTIIYLEDNGPIFFVQKRIGYKNKIFKMYKFRSMLVNTEHVGDGYYCYEGDKRVTSIGKFMRKYSLDELPQLINILKLEMSIVGPRPAIYDEFKDEKIEEENLLWIKERTRVLPGLTGFAQVFGRNDLNWNQKLQLDAKYLKLPIYKRFILDFKIIIVTFLAILSPKGIYDKK